MKSNLFNKQLTDVDSVKTTVRPMSTHVDVEKILVYIDESQQQDIKNALGDNLLLIYSGMSTVKKAHRSMKPMIICFMVVSIKKRMTNLYFQVLKKH